jgi:hypothetical protein
MTPDFCVEALEEAIGRHGVPEIVNTDQGSQFTGCEFIEKLKSHAIAISMDGKGCWRDNVCLAVITREALRESPHANEKRLSALALNRLK